MPYINQYDRLKYVGIIADSSKVDNAGELNYVITTICDRYMGRKIKSYSTINEIIGVLECAKQEFYRRIAIPYEDVKNFENGEVYVQ